MEKIIDFLFLSLLTIFSNYLKFHYYRIRFYKNLSIYKTNSMKYLCSYLNVFNISSFLLRKWKRSSIFLILFQFYFYYNFISVILKILYIKYIHIYPSIHPPTRTHPHLSPTRTQLFLCFKFTIAKLLSSLEIFRTYKYKYFSILSSLNILFMENVLKQNIVVHFLKCIFLVFLDKGIHKRILQKCRISRSAIIYKLWHVS